MRLNLRLIPGFFIKALAGPFMLGAAKYEEGDWASQEDPEQFIKDRTDSLMNHLCKYLDGEEYDSEGPHHLAAVAWNALAVLYYKTKIEDAVYEVHSGMLRNAIAKRIEEKKHEKLTEPKR